MIAWLLLALWLPATQHCGLEAADWIDDHGVHEAAPKCCTAEHTCATDDCAIVEGLFTKSSDDVAKAPLPVLTACACLICLELVGPVAVAEPVWAPTDSVRQPDWIPEWTFVRRAALSPRAPSGAV